MMYNPGTIVFGQVVHTKYGTARPWQEQWHQALVHFKELKAAHQPGGYRSDAAGRAAVENFFDHCLRVKDWAYGDALNTKRGKNKLDNLFKNNYALNLCRDIANTTKHRGRNQEDDRNAVVRRVFHRDDNSPATCSGWPRSPPCTAASSVSRWRSSVVSLVISECWRACLVAGWWSRAAMMELSLPLVVGSGYARSAGWAASNTVELDDRAKRILGLGELAAWWVSVAIRPSRGRPLLGGGYEGRQ